MGYRDAYPVTTGGKVALDCKVDESEIVALLRLEVLKRKVIEGEG